VTIQVLPHVLSYGSNGTQGLLAVDFTNAGPSTVNHVFETITTNVPTGTVFTPSSADCSSSGSTVTCNIGQVAPGTTQRFITFSIPAGAIATTSLPFKLNAAVSTTFDEGKTTGLTDTVTDTDVGTVAAATDGTRKGQCAAAQGDTLTAANLNQQTTLTYNGLPTSLVPCTPGDAGVDPGHPDVKGVFQFGDTSFVEFLDGAGLGRTQIILFNPPNTVKKTNLYFVEYANYPDLTPTANGKAVPKCATDASGNPTFPANSAFRSCVISIANISGGGLVGTLLVQGGTDPGWGTGQ
jgi:hypothetical protein